jgi:hypothetical protein
VIPHLSISSFPRKSKAIGLKLGSITKKKNKEQNELLENE